MDGEVPTFREPRLLGDIPRALAEPNVAVSPNGTIVVTTPLYLWRSFDGGATFEWVGEPACHLDVPLPTCPDAFVARSPKGLVGLGDGDIAFGPDGRLHWAGLAAPEARVPYQTSLDSGVTWSEPFDVAEGEGADREWLDVDAEGTVRLVWSQFHGQSPYTVFRAMTNGTWSDVVELEGDERLKGPIARDARSGALYVPSVDFTGLHVAVSRDDGLTWEDSPVHATGAPRGIYLGSASWIFPVAAVDDAGTVYVAWSGDEEVQGVRPARDASTPRVYLSTSTDGGTTWTGPMLLSAPQNAAIFPWVVAGAEGRIAVAWYESALPAVDAAPSVWNVRLVESFDATTPEPTFVGGLLNRDPVHVGVVCTAGGGCAGRDRTKGDFFEVAIDARGHPVAAWAGDSPTPVQHTTVWFGGVAAGTPLR